MPRKTTHRKYYRIILIPDDRDEPKAFSVPVKRMRYIRLLLGLLGLHIVLGFVFYYQYYRIHIENTELEAINQKLVENNARINKLTSEVNAFEMDHSKLRSLLGLGAVSNDENMTASRIPDETWVEPSISPYSRNQRQVPASNIARQRPSFLKRSESSVHDYEKSIPTLLPVEGVLSKDYENKTYASPRQHHGIDIAAQSGSPVRAAAAGVVDFAGWTTDFGNLIILNHGNGFRTFYGHNQQYHVPRGAFVEKGDIIASVGNTGISSASHLHFEIWRDGAAVDPKDYILAFIDYSN